jgi:hypothetical protein
VRPPKRKSRILLPKYDGGFYWPELEVKQSNEKNAGNGLFAKVPLRAGTVIPSLGVLTKKKGTHVYDGQDGNPKINPFKGVGNWGLSIAMMANEPLRKKPRCKFMRGYLVVAMHVKAGEELTVYYGNNYRRGYSLAKNRYLEAEYKQLDKVTLPSRRTVATAVNQMAGLSDEE